MAAHWSRLMAPVPESVSRSMITSSAWRLNRFQPAFARAAARSATVVIRIGSTEWIRNGSMIVCQSCTNRHSSASPLAAGENESPRAGAAGGGNLAAMQRGDVPAPAVLPRPSGLRTLLMSLAALAAALVFLALIVIAVVVLAWIVLSLLDQLPDPDRKWPRLSAWAIALIPAAALLLAFFVSRRSEGGTFYEQQLTNRVISVLLLIAIIGLLVALGEAIAASLTFDSYWALFGAGIASLLGTGAAAYAYFAGSKAVLSSARARTADPVSERVLFDVVSELSIAANMPPPQVAVIDDASINALAVGTKPGNAVVAVTTGALRNLDREQLQGVVAHELSHIRNLDSRYGVYVAVLVGLVALVTDGFLR